LEVDGAPAWPLSTSYWRADARRHPLVQIEGQTSSTGEVTLSGLQPGRHRVEIVAAGLCYDRRNGVEVAPGETAAVEFALERDGVLQGVLPNGVFCFGLRRDGVPGLHYCANVSDAFFTLPALRPGTYQVLQSNAWEDRLPQRGQGWTEVLGSAEVVAGRTTWVDLRDASVEHAGAVVDAHGPVAGVRVGFLLGSTGFAVTDGHGRFALDFGWYVPPYGKFSLTKGPMKWWVPTGTTTIARPDYIEIRLPEHALEVKTLDRYGQPVAARVNVRSDHGAPGWPKAFAVLDTDVGGRVRVDHLYGDEYGKYEVEARFADGATVRAHPVLPRTEPLVLRAPASGDLEIHVRDQNGIPLAYGPVWVWTADPAQPTDKDSLLATYRNVVTDVDGVVRLRGAAAGELWIQAEPSRSSTQCVLRPDETLRVDVEVTVGPRDR